MSTTISPVKIEHDRRRETSAAALQYPHDSPAFGARDMQPQRRGGGGRHARRPEKKKRGRATFGRELEPAQRALVDVLLPQHHDAARGCAKRLLARPEVVFDAAGLHEQEALEPHAVRRERGCVRHVEWRNQRQPAPGLREPRSRRHGELHFTDASALGVDFSDRTRRPARLLASSRAAEVLKIYFSPISSLTFGSIDSAQVV